MQLHCIVKPQSKVDSIALLGDALRVKIKALPVDGAANEYLVEYLATFFRLPKKNIQILSGFTSSHKRVNIVADDSYIQTALAGLKSQ